MTWEGRKCGGLLTTQNQGQIGNLPKQKIKLQPTKPNNSFFIKTKKNQGIISSLLSAFTIAKEEEIQNSRSRLPKLVR